jgi:hypothetical protein
MAPRDAATRFAARALIASLALASGCALFEKPTCPTRKYEAPDERFVFFTAGKIEVQAEGLYTIGYVTAQLDTDPSMHVLIVGHADPQGRADANRELSFKRARAVRKVLMEHGIKDKRILIAAPKEQPESTLSQLGRRADLFVYDPVQDEASKRLGYTVDVRSE